HVVKQIIHDKTSLLSREIGDSRRLTYPLILQSARQVVPKQVELHTNFYVRNRVTLHMGQASFVDQHMVTVELLDGARETITAESIVIATGSRPYRPADVDFNHPRVYDSDTILEM